MAKPLHVLLIEDNPDDALLIEAELAGEFASEVIRIDSRQALGEALSKKWDIVISDYSLPQFDGLEALQMVREAEPELPFILVSGAVGEEVAAKAMRSGAYDFILKNNLFRLVPSIRRSLNDAEDKRQRRMAEDALRTSEERYRALFNSIDEGFCVVEMLYDDAGRPIDYRFIAANPAFEKHTGIKDVIGRRMREIAPDQEAYWDEIFGRVAQTGDSIRFEQRAYALGRFFDIYAFRIGDPEERLVAILFNDITERKQVEEELQLAALVYQESAEAMMVTDEANRIVSVNQAFERVTGYSSEEVIGKTPIILSAGRNGRVHYREMLQRLSNNHYWQGELWLRKKTGEEFAVAMTVNSTFHADGAVNRHVILFADVTQKKQAEELVWYQANFDVLTGLPNRRHFLDQLMQEIRKSRRSGLPLALMFLDLDGFKHVNDTLGHEAGDMLLKETAGRLAKCVRETDTVARLGGDEFTIILSELKSVRHVEKVARHILHKLSEPFQLSRELAHLSGSLGITLYPQDASNLDDLLINADNAMYAAKEAGKNRYRFFTASMQKAAQERMWMVSELRHAIDSRQFRLVYQPIVDLASGLINKAEALLRWEHPERGTINPSVFIPVAEDTGLIQEIGDWVFFEATSQVAKWRQAYQPDFQISINKSPIQFKARVDDLSSWFKHLKMLNLPGQSVAVEITEGVLMDESKAVANQLLAFRDNGIEVSLDDFGTGYSTLSYLKRFDIDRLKIDQTFIRDLESDANDQALCEAMIVMGHKLGIKVIAEGVETDGQRDLLVNAGCDFAQGYLFSKPIGVEEFESLLEFAPLSSRAHKNLDSASP